MGCKITDESIFAYHASDAVSSSKLNCFHESSTKYFEQFVAKTMPPEESWSFDFGQAHHAQMEGQAAFDRYTVPMQFKDFRTDAAKEWRDKMKAENKMIVTADEMTALRKMKAKIEAHPIAAQLIAETEAEVTFRRSFGKYNVQCRADRWNDKPREIRLPSGQVLCVDRHFIDFKTCASIAKFRKDWINFGYHRQKVFYQSVIQTCQATDSGVDTTQVPLAEGFWIVSETNPPHECRVFSLMPDSLAVARAEVMMDLKALRNCYETGNWSAPAEIEMLELPRWSVDQTTKRLEEHKSRLELNA